MVRLRLISPDRTGVRIVVVGDQGTGKSTLIRTAFPKDFCENVAPVLPPTRLPIEYFPDRVPITIIDTPSAGDEIDEKIVEELQLADAVVLAFAHDSLETVERLRAFWIPRLHDLQGDTPIILVGCKFDLLPNNQEEGRDNLLSSIVDDFNQVETFYHFSPSTSQKAIQAFYKAQQVVLHPKTPLLDLETGTLKPKCRSALKRIFKLIDVDGNDALDDEELDQFQATYYNYHVGAAELVGLRDTLTQQGPGAVNELGVTLTGFEYLFLLFVDIGNLATAWTMLRLFGYNDSIELADHIIPPLKCTSDQSVELTHEAIEFLEETFASFDADNDQILQPGELEELFSTAPNSPWIGNLYEHAVQRNESGELSLNAFLSEWALMTLLNPRFSIKHLIYIGYAGDPLSAVRVTGKRHTYRKKQHSERNVLQCFVFGPRTSGKSTILNSFIERPYSEIYNPTNEDRYAVKIVGLSRGNRKFLVLKEIAEGGVERLVADKDSLASCDIAIFVHDRSDRSSWEASHDLLVQIAGHGERTGFELPCLIVGAKNDLGTFEFAIQDLTRVSEDMGVDDPISISVKLGDLNGLFDHIVYAAEHPHLSIPETEDGKSRKQLNKLVSLSIVCVSVAVVVIGGYRVYAATKSGSG